MRENEPKCIDYRGGIHFAYKRLRSSGYTDSRPDRYSKHGRSGCFHYGCRDSSFCANGDSHPTHRDGKPDSATFEHAAAITYVRNAWADSHRRTDIHAAGASGASTTHIQLGERRRNAGRLQSATHRLARTYRQFQRCQPNSTPGDDRSIHVCGDRLGSVRVSHH